VFRNDDGVKHGEEYRSLHWYLRLLKKRGFEKRNPCQEIRKDDTGDRYFRPMKQACVLISEDKTSLINGQNQNRFAVYWLSDSWQEAWASRGPSNMSITW